MDDLVDRRVRSRLRLHTWLVPTRHRSLPSHRRVRPRCSSDTHLAKGESARHDEEKTMKRFELAIVGGGLAAARAILHDDLVGCGRPP